MTLLDQVERYYSNKIVEHGATAAGVDWRDQASQEIRFSELVKVTRGARSGGIADIGCGWGAFALWAQREGYCFDYAGYDISEPQLDAAKAACRSLSNASFTLGSKQFAPTDWVIASGIFNVRFGISDADWRQHIERTIDELASAARLGFAFNCLTGFSDIDRKLPRLYYPYPGEMLDTIMKRYGRHASLSHGYGLYEFTICSWKS